MITGYGGTAMHRLMRWLIAILLSGATFHCGASPAAMGKPTALGHGEAVSFAVDPYDGSSWFATRSRLLLHVGADASVLGGTTLPTLADAMSVALDQSIWLIAGGTLSHHGRDGRWLETRAVPGMPDAGPMTIAVDSLGERLWITGRTALLQIALDPRSTPTGMHIPLDCEVDASTLNPRTGQLFVSCAGRLYAFNRNGGVDVDMALRDAGLDAIDAVAYDGATDTVLVSGPSGTLRIAVAGTSFEMTGDAEAGAYVDPVPFSVLPTLELIRPPDGAATDESVIEMVFAVGASCSALPCQAPAGYMAGMKLSVEVNGLRLADPAIDVATGHAVVRGGTALQPGPNRITASVNDRFGHRASLTDATLTLLVPSLDAAPVIKAANRAPTVALTSPANGAILTAGSSVTLSATASDSDGSIARVEFYLDASTLIGAAVSAPYASAWANIPSGSHVLTARAYDNRNGKTMSAPVTVTVVDNQRPIVSLASPPDGSFHVSGSPIALAANASDSDGSIARVEFFDGTTLLATVATPPWTWTWPNARTGRHAVGARATDDRGATGSSAITYVVIGDAPKVVVTEPAACSQVDGPVELALAAEAASSGGSIVRVEFFDGGTSVGAVSSAPWRTTLANARTGTHSITARATDSHGLATISRAAVVEVRGANQPPTVSLVTPSDGARYPIGTSVGLTASAADADGAITAVEYRIGVGGAIIGRATAAPYAVAWSGMAIGTYTLVAVAYDDRGASTTSPAASVTIAPNAAPSVALATPADGATFVAPATINLVATASDADGSIAKVEFLSGTALVATATVAPFTADWSNVPAGSYSLTARATDNLGATASSTPISVSVTANVAPIVTLTAPSAGAHYFAPATVQVTASASDPDGAIARVEFYANGSLVGTASNAPYSIVWDGIAAGAYTLVARAIDNLGAGVDSSSISIDVAGALTINIGPGLANAVIDDDRVTVQGIASAPENSAVTVNGIVAHIDDLGHFNLNDVPLVPGINTLTAVVTSIDGQTGSQAITLESTGPAAFTVDASPTEGLGSLTVRFSITNPARTPFKEIIIDLDGDGYPNLIATPADVDDGAYAFTATYPEGTWTATITALDDANQPIYSTTRVIVVLMPQLFEGRLRAVYDGMLARLRAGNIPGALNAFTGSAYAKYNAIFTQLQASLPTLVDQIGDIEDISFGIDLAELSLVRNTADGPQRFMIYLIRAEDGIWRIDSM